MDGSKANGMKGAGFKDTGFKYAGIKDTGFVAGCQRTNVDLIYQGLPRVPEEGSELYAEDFSVQMGGGYPGILCNLARLGVPVRLMTELGSDMFSGFAAKYFKDLGIDVINLSSGSSGIPVNISSVMITPSDRTFLSYGSKERWSDVMSDLVRRHTAGAKICLLDPEHPDLYRPLKGNGTTLVLDTGWDDSMSLETFEELLDLADYYTPNQKEAMKLTGTDTPEKAVEVLSRYFPRVIVKVDADGCLIAEEGKLSRIPAIPDTPFKDATGAGDAFLAGFLFGLYHDLPFRTCVLCGNIMGARCVTAVGCLTAGYTQEEMWNLLKRYGGQ